MCKMEYNCIASIYPMMTKCFSYFICLIEILKIDGIYLQYLFKKENNIRVLNIAQHIAENNYI